MDQRNVKSQWARPGVAVLATTEAAMGGYGSSTPDGIFCDGVEGFFST